jgi:hypothetical protein
MVRPPAPQIATSPNSSEIRGIAPLIYLYLLDRIKLFGANFREVLGSDQEWEEAVDDVVAALESVGRQQHNGAFTVNYVRLRFVAQKPE